MPLKKICGDTDSSIYNTKGKHTLIKLIELLIIKYLMPYDYFKKIVSATISSGELFIPFLKSAFFLSENRIWTTGLPRTDFYFENKTEGIVDSIRKKYIDSRIVLYMPTFRDFVQNMGIPYNPFDDKNFVSESFLNFLNNENIVFLYKPHLRDIKFKYSLSTERFVLINDEDYDELYVLISNIDILITDYSSVYFDYLCLNKPAILAPFDYEDYISKSRNLYFDYILLPSIKAYNWNELMDIIKEKKYFSISKEERDKFCKYNDGHASERVLQKTLELLAERS
jgi:CDP-glycerol glycerophosphotransferase (TagB/SpsB family)